MEYSNCLWILAFLSSTNILLGLIIFLCDSYWKDLLPYVFLHRQVSCLLILILIALLTIDRQGFISLSFFPSLSLSSLSLYHSLSLSLSLSLSPSLSLSLSTFTSLSLSRCLTISQSFDATPRAYSR